jgi:hypothetical protein
MAKVVGDIAVEVGANVVPFQRGMDAAGRSTKQFDKQFSRTAQNVKRAGAAMALAAVAVAAGLAKVTKDALAAAEGIADIANKSGASVQGLQRLRFAADQNGASARDMDDALTRLTRRMSLFAVDGSGPAAKAIEQLGLNIRNTDGSLRASDEVFTEIAERMATLEDSAQKAALASQLFGEDAGPRLVPLLSQGAAGVKAFGDEAERLGIVLDEAGVRKAGEVNAKLRALGMSLTGTLQGAILDNVEAIEALATGMSAIIGVVASAVEQVAKLVSEMVGLYDATRSVLGLASRQSTGETFGSRNSLLAETYGLTPRQAARRSGEIIPGDMLLPPSLPPAQYPSAPLGFGDTQVLGGGGFTLNRGGVTMGPTPSFGLPTPDNMNGEPRTIWQALGIDPNKPASDADFSLGSGGGKTTFEQELDRQKMALETLRTTGQATYAALGNFVQQFAGKNKAAAIAAIAIQKGLSISQIISNSAAAQMRALAELGPIAGPPVAAKIATMGKIQAGLVAATGLAQAASAAGGGGSSAGGGAGGVAAAAAQAPLNVRLSGVSADSFVSGANIGDLLDRLNEEAGDRGYRILRAS